MAKSQKSGGGAAPAVLAEAAVLDADRPGPPKTLADRLRVQLSDEIVSGQLAPGVALDETEIARRFNVSRTPVREAIRLLVASGLVDARPHRSAVVARPGKDQLLAMFEALRELEALCARLAAERMSAAEQKEIQQINEMLLVAVRKGDPQRYHETNEMFHSAIYAGSHNTYLAGLTAATRARIAPFSRAQFYTIGRLAKSHEEHQRVLEAIMRGKSAQAAAAMRAHIESVYDSFDLYLRRGPSVA
jgi:DNA-binding GntR family transcriptional regulator